MKRFSIIKIIIFIAFVLLSFQVMTIPAKAQLTDQDIQTLNEEILSNGYNFTIGLNSATARSLHDLAGLVPPENWDKDASTDVSRFQAMEDSDGGYLPPSLNWYDINPVKDQGTCRACWAFSTVSVLESAITISSGVEIDLSEQYLISCNCDNNWDCTNGGWFAHDYHEWKNCLEEEETGAVLETEFPYGASDTPCTGSYTRHKIINWAFISSTSPIPTVNEIKRALLNYGPISAAVVADSFFQAYTGGIFDGCINDVNNVNHAIVLTGWCDDVTVPSGGYWYLKNSWGEGWGQNGYMRIAYGANCVGYAANFITPAVAPVAYFTGSPTFGIPPLTVQFTDLSLYNPDAWSWDFGDGNISCEQNPTHIFTDPGIYTVSLIAHSAFGPSDPLDFENYITIVVENTRTFCDSFDTNKPSLNPYLGNWEVVDNKYQGYYSSKGFSFGDVGEVEKAIIALDWTSLSSNGWLMGRIDFGWKNEANFRCIEMKDGENRWHIREYKDGVRSSLANVKETIETNKEYHLEVNIDENGLVTLFVDGVEKLSYDFGTPVSGRLGVGVENSKSRFDNICITVENKTPVAKDGSYNTDEDQSISDEMYASDAEDDNLTYSIVSPPVMGIVEITDAATGDFTYTPNENDYGDDSFTFKVNDGTIDSNTATVTITIDPVNDKPVASDSTFSTNEDVVITEDSLDASDIDEKDNLTYSIVFPPYPDMGIVEITNAATGAFTYTPNENANGTDSFAFKVNDGTIDSNTATVTIEIVPVNDAPVITSQAPKTAIEDEMYTYNPTALDVDHVNLTWSLSTDTEGMIFDSATDTISWTPGEGVLTSDIVLLTVSDAQGDSDSQEFTISVTPVNDPPVITSEAPTTATEDEMYTYNPTALDVDDVNLTWSLSTAPEGMSIDGAGKISWTPGEGVLTSDIVLLTVSDAQGDSDSQEFTISVTPVNDAPSITGIPLTSVLENVSYEFTPESFDAEGSSLVFRIINIPGWAIFDTETGALTGIPTSEYIGITRGIIIAVSDGELEDALPPFDLSVIKVNDAPSADAQTVETDKNQEIDIILTATDPDGDSLNYTVDSAQLQGSLASMAPNLTYTPPSDFVGTDSFSFIADDGELASNSATVSIIVNSNSLAAFVTTKMTKKLKKGKYWIIETKITIKDEASNPLGSALIEGTWSDSKKGSVIKKTDKTGKATFKTYVKDKGKGKDQCFTITRVLKGQDYNLEGELGDCIPAEELTIGRKSKKKDSHTKDHKKKYPKTKKDKK